MLAGRTGKTSTKCRDNAGSDVGSPHSCASVESLAAEDDSYAATFESESHVASADVNAGDNGTIALVCFTLPAKRHRPTGLLCGWSVGVEFFARLLERDSGVGRDKFRHHLKTFMFASY